MATTVKKTHVGSVSKIVTTYRGVEYDFDSLTIQRKK